MGGGGKNKKKQSTVRPSTSRGGGSTSTSITPGSCQEKLDCEGGEAAYGCDECNTLQCEKCEKTLHENARFEHHRRHPLKEPSPSLPLPSPLVPTLSSPTAIKSWPSTSPSCSISSPLVSPVTTPPRKKSPPIQVRTQPEEEDLTDEEEEGEDQEGITPACSSCNKRSIECRECPTCGSFHCGSCHVVLHPPVSVAVPVPAMSHGRKHRKDLASSTATSSSSPSSSSPPTNQLHITSKGQGDFALAATRKSLANPTSLPSNRQSLCSDSDSDNKTPDSPSDTTWTSTGVRLESPNLLPDVAQMSLDAAVGSLGSFTPVDYLTSQDHPSQTQRPQMKGKKKKFSPPSSNSGHQPSSSPRDDPMTSNIDLLSNEVDLLGSSMMPGCPSSRSDSFLILDGNERMQITSVEDFAKFLGCLPNSLVKVVSIFGNTGEGKSHTLNHTFYNGEEVFKTSPAQSSCTIGIWAAYDETQKVVTIDTEGLLGISENNNRRTRLLLKVLAISDIIIYRTRAERLHNDLFTFLGDASRAYGHHFSTELKSASKRSGHSYSTTELGPVVIVFHETLHTDILKKTEEKAPEDELRRRFGSLNLSTESYSAFEYVGTRTGSPPTNFRNLQQAVKRHLQNTTVRSARAVSIVFMALKFLNEKFSGDIEKTIPSTFPDEYFTCSAQCRSCGNRCINSMNHHREGTDHRCISKCVYQHQFDNKVYFCRSCYDQGQECLVVPRTAESNEATWVGLAKYAWYGYILECDRCGVIYRSRQYWYGNSDPFECVRNEVLHIWPGENNQFQGSQNAAQKVIDGIQYITSTASSIGAKPSRQIGSWVADQIAPNYWVPNSMISHCHKCEKEFAEIDTKHHCRVCGQGFCDVCSSKKCPVPERGWDEPVRVCDSCYDRKASSSNGRPEDPDSDSNESDMEDSTSSEVQDLRTSPGVPRNPKKVLPRRVGEAITSTIGNVASAANVPITWIKDSARPEYWIADKDITECCVCLKPFTHSLNLHHCRACGKGVCDECSPQKVPVKSRGWDHPVRVCNTCSQKPSL